MGKHGDTYDKDQMLLHYSQLGDDVTLAGELCPVCKGGRTRERTLSVTREGSTLKWLCHRASCGFRGSSSTGRIGTLPSRVEAASTRGVVGRDYVRNAVEIPAKDRAYLSSELFITDRHVNRWQLGWDEQSSRLVQPVLSPDGDVLGCQLRALDGRQPKALTHTEQGAIAWFINRATPGLIIVEDIFSAIRVADYCSSVALLGTHLNDERIAQIAEVGLAPVSLALDYDAWPKTIGYVKKYRNQLRLAPMKIVKDFKNMTPEELQEVLR